MNWLIKDHRLKVSISKLNFIGFKRQRLYDNVYSNVYLNSVTIGREVFPGTIVDSFDHNKEGNLLKFDNTIYKKQTDFHTPPKTLLRHLEALHK